MISGEEGRFFAFRWTGLCPTVKYTTNQGRGRHFFLFGVICSLAREKDELRTFRLQVWTDGNTDRQVLYLDDIPDRCKKVRQKNVV